MVVECTEVLSPHFCSREGGNQSVTRWHGMGRPIHCTLAAQTQGWQ